MNRLPLYQPLSYEDIQRINDTSLKVLESIGIESSDEDAIKYLTAYGATQKGSRIYFPREVVAKAIASAPKEVILYGRGDERHNLHLTGTNVYIGTGGAALNVIDLDNPKPRAAKLSDIANIARLVEQLENIHFFLRPCEPEDVPINIRDPNKYFAAFCNTSKHVMGSVNSLAGLTDAIELASIIAGSEEAYRARPFLSFICCWMVSPLAHDTETTQLLLEICRKGLPVVISSAPMSGATSPITLAGTLTQIHAELLSGIVLTQAVSPGTPVIYGAVPSLANMQAGNYLGGSIEFGMLNAAATQLAHSLDLPIYNSAGLTEAKTSDMQAGYEKAFSVLQAVLAGTNYIHHAAGMLESMLTVSYEQYVIDNEILGMALRAARGIEVNDETLAYDSIARTGPKGNYLADDLTLEYMRKETFRQPIGDKKTRAEWERSGAPSLSASAKEIARKILAAPPAPILSEEIIARIRDRFDIHSV